MQNERKKKKLKTSIFSLYYNKNPSQMENHFMKKLKEEKYRNITKKLTTQRNVDKNEYNQLKLDLNIVDSSDDLDKEESEKGDIFRFSFTEDDEFYENEINFFGEELIIKQNKKEIDLYEKYTKMKRLKQVKDIQQMEIRNVFRKELKEGILYEKEENDKNSRENKKFIRRKKTKRRKS